MNWWRAHHGISHDAKLCLIARVAKAKKCEVGWVWISLLDYASQNEDRGSIEGLDVEQLAFQTDVPILTVDRILVAMSERGMLTDFRVAAWVKRQYGDVSTERVKRHRENKALNAKCNGMKRDETNETGHETPVTVETPRTEQNRTEQNRYRTDTHTEAVGVREMPRAADLQGQTSQRSVEFADAYPEQSDRASTVREYLSLVTTETEEACFACLERYKRSDQVKRGVVMAGWKWLRQQYENKWQGNWAVARDSPKSKSEERAAEYARMRELEEQRKRNAY